GAAAGSSTRTVEPSRAPRNVGARSTSGTPSRSLSATARCSPARMVAPVTDGARHVVILGAGFAGLELASRLSDSLAGEVRVTLIDRNDSFTFGFSKLDILFGRSDTAAVQIPYRELAKPGVEFRRERIAAIDPANRPVTPHAPSPDADILVVALGADYDIAATPRLA